MPKTPSELAEELSELPASAIAMSIRDETYFDAVRGIVDMFASKKDLSVVYISATIPSNSIIDVLKILEIDMSHIHFVDCVSQSMMSSSKRGENVHQVESPTMLENIMLKVEYLMKKNTNKNSIVLLDSINALAIHNSVKILSEFIHILINNLRAKSAYIIIFSHEGYSSEEISNMMSFVCDLTLSMRKEGDK